MKKLIYADNAATTKLDIDAFEAMKPFLLEDFANPSQPYSFSRSAKKAIKTARNIIADCIGASPEEIYFTSGGTESDNWAIKGVNIYASDKKHIITSLFEHHAILNSCKSIENTTDIIYLKPNEDGIILSDSLQKVMSDNVKLVSIMLGNNEIGTIQPIKKLSEIAHQYGAIFHTDAVQAVGHIPIDVTDLGIDMLSASAHKFNGPKGIGFLYIKKGTKIKPYSDGGAQETSLRAGTENVASIVGMAVALEKNCKNIDNHISHITMLENHLINKLKNNNVNFIRNGNGTTLPGVISLSFNGCDGESILHRLDLMGICVSTGAACDTKTTEISHVLQSMDIPSSYAKGTIRISIGKDNTIDEIDSIADSLIKILK